MSTPWISFRATIMLPQHSGSQCWLSLSYVLLREKFPYTLLVPLEPAKLWREAELEAGAQVMVAAMGKRAVEESRL